MRKKLVRLTTEIFSWGLTLCFFGAFAIALCYIAAFLIGGSFAVGLCSFISKSIFPPMYTLSGLLAIDGMLKMYLNHEKVFLMDCSHKKSKTSSPDTNSD